MHNKISKRFKMLLNLLTAFAFLSVFFSHSTKAYAASLSVPIKVKQVISIDSPYAKPQDSFEYTMEPLEKDSPLPEGKSGVYKFSLKGDQEKQLNIEYQKPGEYTYKIYQNKSTNIKNVIKDQTIYTLTINIGKNGDNLEKELIVIKNSSGKKSEEIIFHNHYKVEEGKNPGGSTDPNEPGSSENDHKSEDPGQTEKPDKPSKPNEDQAGLPGKNANNNIKTGVNDYIKPILLIMLLAGGLLILSNKRDKEELD